MKPRKKRARQKKHHDQEDYTFSQNQYEDYLTLNGIVNRTGIAKEDSYTLFLKELLDNDITLDNIINQLKLYNINLIYSR
ncbi:MAG: hypothetical protein WBF33_13550 [Candidatus Nitrosopolaris sp.]